MPNTYLLTALISAFVLVVFQGRVHGQATVADPQQRAKSHLLVIDPDGWPVPNNAKDKAASTTDLTLDGTRIQVTKYIPGDRRELTIPLFSVDDSGVLVQRRKTAELRSYSTLARSGKIFGYTLDLQQFGVSETAGRMDFGPPIFIAVIDGDGDGIFESRIYSPSGTLEKIPEWVKRLASDTTSDTGVNRPMIEASNSIKASCENRWYTASGNAKCYRLQKQLIEAAGTGDLTGITGALDKGANVEGVFDSSFPALYTAVMSGQKDAVRLLLDRGANINRVLTFGKTPLKAAVYYDQPELAQILIERSADICENSPDEGSAWKIAEVKGNPTIIKILKQAGAERCSK